MSLITILIITAIALLFIIGYTIYVLVKPMEWWVNKVGDEYIKEKEKH